MRTNIVIDQDLIEEAKNISGLKTKKDIVEAGIKCLIKTLKQQEILKYEGKLQWEGNLEESRLGRI